MTFERNISGFFGTLTSTLELTGPEKSEVVANLHGTISKVSDFSAAELAFEAASTRLVGFDQLEVSH